MSMKNTKCKQCGKKYHACSNCGIEDYEYDFCNFECLTKYREENLPKVLERWKLDWSVEKLDKFIADLDAFYMIF